MLGLPGHGGLGGGHVHHDDPGEAVPLLEAAQILSQPARGLDLRPTVRRRVITGSQLGFDRTQPVAHPGQQPVRQHSALGEQLGALGQRRVHDVVPATVRKRHAGPLQIGDGIHGLGSKPDHVTVQSVPYSGAESNPEIEVSSDVPLTSHDTNP